MSVSGFRMLAALCLVPWIGSGVAYAAVFQFEVLAISDDWIVIRENVPASPADTAACRYPGLDPSEYVGVKVLFVRLPPEAKRGQLVPLAAPESSLTISEPRGACTSAADAEQRWRQAAERAKNLGTEWRAKPPVAAVLTAAVPARTCSVIGGAVGRPPCLRVVRQRLHASSIQIGVSLAAVPQSPDERVCQFVGHRYIAVLQVAGPNFGTQGTVAPGGSTEHYDCRGQQFQPLRFYDLDRFAVVVGGFGGTNIADRIEHAFLLIFPTRPAA